MCPSLLNKHQNGSMLLTAIFVLIVMSLLGLTLTRLLSASSDAVTHEVYGIKAMNAAQSGLQRKIADAFPLDGSAALCDGAGESPLNLALNNIVGLENCSAVATCTQTSYDGGDMIYYRFMSTGTCIAGNNVTSRTVAVDGKVEL